MLARHQLLLGTSFFRMAIIFTGLEFLSTIWFYSVFLSILSRDLLEWHLIQNLCTCDITVPFLTTLALHCRNILPSNFVSSPRKGKLL